MIETIGFIIVEWGVIILCGMLALKIQDKTNAIPLTRFPYEMEN